MSTCPQSGARGFERLPCLKYNVLTGENRLTLGLNTAKNTDCMKKIWSESCWQFNSYKKLKFDDGAGLN